MMASGRAKYCILTTPQKDVLVVDVDNTDGDCDFCYIFHAGPTDVQYSLHAELSTIEG